MFSHDIIANQLCEHITDEELHKWVRWVIINGSPCAVQAMLDRFDDISDHVSSDMLDRIMRDDRIEVLKIIMTRLPYEFLLGDSETTTLPALHIFSETRTHECTLFLLDFLRIEDINAPFGTQLETALHVACREKCTEAVKLLLPRLDPYTLQLENTIHFQTAFQIMCKTKRMDGILAFGDYMTIEMWKQALYIACTNNDPALSSLALQHLTDDDLKDVHECGDISYIYVACLSANTGTLSQLLLRCDVAERDSTYDNTALQNLCKLCKVRDEDMYISTISMLINAMSPDECASVNYDGDTALSLAVTAKRWHAAELIIQKSTIEHLSTAQCVTRLLRTVYKAGPLSTIVMIVDKLGVDALRSPNSYLDDAAPIWILIDRCNKRIFNVIVPRMHDDDLNIMTINGGNILHCWNWGLNWPVLGIISRMRRDVLSSINHCGRTVLHTASRNNISPSIIVALLETMTLDAISHIDEDGNTAFHYACSRGEVSIIEAYVQRCDRKLLTCTNMDGKTPRDLFLDQCVATTTHTEDLYRLFTNHVKNATIA